VISLKLQDPSEQVRFETKNTVQLIVAHQKKYSGIYLTKHTHDPCEENYKLLVKEIKEQKK
jgi:hypothetical protein